MSVAILDRQGRVIWLQRTHSDNKPSDVLGTRAWEWQPAGARERGRLMFADALLLGQSGPARLPIEVRGKQYDHTVTYQAVPDAAVVCTWYEYADVRLSPRELEVLKLLCDDLRPAQVARRLGISASTVDTYRASLRRKLGVRSVAGKVRWAIRAGVVSL